MRLRQVVLVAEDLERTVAELCGVFGIEVAYRDPAVAAFGLCNAVMPIGDTFLEVVSPITTEAPARRYLERRGSGGYMLMVQSDDFDADRARVARLGVRVAWDIELDDIRGMHLHPRDTGGTLLSIDQPLPASGWRWAGPEWRAHLRTESVEEIVAAELQSADPSALARRWSAILGHPAEPGAEGTTRIALDRGEIRFVLAAADHCERLGGFTVRTRDRARGGTALALAGVRIQLA